MSKRPPVVAVPGLVPSPRTSGIYPWRTMQAGESFLSRASDPATRAMASRMGRQLKRQFSVRITPEGLRVWRVK